jgi:nitrite reductase/ring-hydroxylating ferredoxin subunit
MSQLLCVTPADSPIGEIHHFEILWKGMKMPGLAFLDRQGSWFACINRCKHWAEALDTESPAIYATGTGLVVCSIHGAKFRLEDGLCVTGPCHGSALDVIPVEWREGELWSIK